MSVSTRSLFAVGLALITPHAASRAWDYEGHRLVNQVALAALPADFPAFVRAPAAAEHIAYLGGGPDRWRNTADLPVKHATSLDHYFDVEYVGLAGLRLEEISDLRYTFVRQYAPAREKHAAAFPPIVAEKNTDQTQEWPGFLPWTITEHYGKLMSAFSVLRTFQELGTEEEIANAEADVIRTLGMMGHYVGDSAQPLHTTMHHNGWVGDNPQGYSRWPGLHAWIDGGFIARAGIGLTNLLPRVRTARIWDLPPTGGPGRDPMFVAVLDHVLAQHALVEPLYQMDKAGVFKGETAASSVEGRRFIEDRLLAGGHALADLWLMAWKNAGPDVYLQGKLRQRANRPR
jgi:hypothetical protein